MNEAQADKDKYDEIFEAVLSAQESEFSPSSEKRILSKSSITEKVKSQRSFESQNSKINLQPKKRRETTKDRLLEWINFYSENKFGIWIQCTKCNKWRKEMEYEEDHEVPRDWCCSMSSSTSGMKSCDDPENTEEDFSPVDLIPGSIVWAKLDGYPWWPGMVEDDPDTEEFYWIENETTWYYNITFLDDKVSHAWVPASCVCSFLTLPPRQRKHSERKYMKTKYTISMLEAAERKAKEALTMSIKERLQKFSFAQRYGGKWPLAKNLDDDYESTQDITEMLIKEVEDIESIKSSDSGNLTESSEEQIKENEMDEAMIDHVISDYTEKLNSKCNNTENDGNELNSKFGNTNLEPITPQKDVISFSKGLKSKIQPLKDFNGVDNIKVKKKKVTGIHTCLETISFPQKNNSTTSIKINIGKNKSFKETIKVTPLMGEEIEVNKTTSKKKLVNTKKNSQNKAHNLDTKENEDRNITNQKRKYEPDEEIKATKSKLAKQKKNLLFKPPVKGNESTKQCQETPIENKNTETSDNIKTCIPDSNLTCKEKYSVSELTISNTNSLGKDINSKKGINKTQNLNNTVNANVNIKNDELRKGIFSNKTNHKITNISATTKESLQRDIKANKTGNISKNTTLANELKKLELKKQNSTFEMQKNKVNSENEKNKILEKNLNNSIKSNQDHNSEAMKVDFKAESNNSPSDALNTGNTEKNAINQYEDIEITKSAFENDTKNHKYECEYASNNAKVKSDIKKEHIGEGKLAKFKYNKKQIRELKMQKNKANSENDILKILQKNLNSSIECDHGINIEAMSIDFKAESNNSISETLHAENKMENSVNNFPGVAFTKTALEDNTGHHKFQCDNASNNTKDKTDVTKKKSIVRRNIKPLTNGFTSRTESLKSNIQNYSTDTSAQADSANGYKQTTEVEDLTDSYENEVNHPKYIDSEDNFSLSLNLNTEQAENEDSDPFEAE